MPNQYTPKVAKRRGRKKGTPNKKTLERLEQERIDRVVAAEVAQKIGDEEKARELVTAVRSANRRLAKDVLAEMMGVFYGLAAMTQPVPAGQPIPPGRSPSEAQFEKWARLAVDSAAKLAPYESPTFKAVAIISNTDIPDGPGPVRFIVEYGPA